MQATRYEVTPDGRTQIYNYNAAKPFASFFPGVAGLRGKPLWAFYVNRGQCISAFGAEDCNHAMLDFSSANVAYQNTPRTGFRTFLRVTGAEGLRFYEPFRPSLANREYGVENVMAFDPVMLQLREQNSALGLEVEVSLMTVPGEALPALARRVRIRNTGKAAVTLEWVDGLPWVTAFGLDYPTAKLMTYTSKSWVVVHNVENKAPYCQLRCMMSDSVDLKFYEHGNFAFHLDGQGLLPALVDPACVFGPNTDLDLPQAFLDGQLSGPPASQALENMTPCAMTWLQCRLVPGETREIIGVFGQSRGTEQLNRFAATVNGADWFERKRAENAEIIGAIQNPAVMFLLDSVYDHYCRMTFLDNALRGGLPVTLPDASGRRRTFQVFSRIHGDMERDYNSFKVETAFWSQGNGAYRDVLQNRRQDIYANRDVGDGHIRAFMNLIRLDSYNPHFLLGTVFVPALEARVSEVVAEGVPDPGQAETVKKLFWPSFTPGSVLTALFEQGIQTAVAPEALLGQVLAFSEAQERVHPVSGFWSDHWHYNLELIQSYLSVFPENERHLLFEDSTYTYLCGVVHVRPRHERYGMHNGRPFQLNFLDVTGDAQAEYTPESLMARTQNGQGAVYRTTLYAKLLNVAALRMATLDPMGMGIEFEAGRPNWNDSVNGLPGIFGSSSCETLELLRLVEFLLGALPCAGSAGVRIHRELDTVIGAVRAALAASPGDSVAERFAYWDATNTAKETYRTLTRNGVSGEECVLPAPGLKAFLAACRVRLQKAVERCMDPQTGLINGYFSHDLVEYDTRNEGGVTRIVPRRFEQHVLAPFLEAPMHYLRVIGDPVLARRQYRAVRASGLYDAPLRMYKVTASLKDTPPEVGRITIFSPGWLENESVWLHMEYKYLLEVLAAGLHDEFFEDFRHCLVPFQDPERYGRSPLENCSFLVCSGNPNAALRGQGFYARLSGATAEFVSIWLRMNLGPRPFRLSGDGLLRFQPEPVLAGWLFHQDARTVVWQRRGTAQDTVLPANHYAFVLFNETLVVYVNPRRGDTFGAEAVRIRRVELQGDDGTVTRVKPEAMCGALARQIRSGDFRMITLALE